MYLIPLPDPFEIQHQIDYIANNSDQINSVWTPYPWSPYNHSDLLLITPHLLIITYWYIKITLFWNILQGFLSLCSSEGVVDLCHHRLPILQIKKQNSHEREAVTIHRVAHNTFCINSEYLNMLDGGESKQTRNSCNEAVNQSGKGETFPSAVPSWNRHFSAFLKLFVRDVSEIGEKIRKIHQQKACTITLTHVCPSSLTTYHYCINKARLVHCQEGT